MDFISVKDFQLILLWSCFCCLIFRILLGSWFRSFLALRRDPWKCGTDVAWRSDVQCHRFVFLNVSWLCERTHTPAGDWEMNDAAQESKVQPDLWSGVAVMKWGCMPGTPDLPEPETGPEITAAASSHSLCCGSTDVFKSVVKSIVLVHAHVTRTKPTF